MATHVSAIKRNRQNQKRRQRNKIIRTKMKSTIKSLLTVADGKDQAASQEALKNTIATIAKTVTKGVIHKKTASRKISRLTKRVTASLQKG